MIEQWDRSQPTKRNMYKSLGSYRYGTQYNDSPRYNLTQLGNNSTGKKLLTCFMCAKIGHVARKCRFRQLDTHKQPSTNVNPVDVKPIVCFTCEEVGHKSPQCPKHPKYKVKCVLTPECKIVHLPANDIMATVCKHKGSHDIRHRSTDLFGSHRISQTR